MSLLALQRDFQRHLLDMPGGTIDAWVGAPAPGLAVYHNAYRVQLTDCLAETFAQTLAWLGGEAFVGAARAHINRTPPSGWTLGIYGDGFDRTLAKLYPDDPEIAELARIEWLLSRAFEAENVAVLDVTAIAGIDWDVASLEFAPICITPAITNAGAIWFALAAGDPPPAAVMLPASAITLVWRQDFTPCFRTLEPIEQEAITLAKQSTGFAKMCAMLVDTRGQNDGLALAGQMLGQWFSDGLIVETTTPLNSERPGS